MRYNSFFFYGFKLFIFDNKVEFFFSFYLDIPSCLFNYLLNLEAI